MFCFRLSLFLIPGLIISMPLVAQEIDLDAVNAWEDFRWGVISYNKSSYNDAIRSFERALSLKPDELLYKEWLGNALYRSGFVASAEELWTAVLAEKSDPLINNRLELRRFRSFFDEESPNQKKYGIFGIITDTREEGVLFRRPSSLHPLKDGGFLVAAFGSNEVLSFDINGAIRARYAGGLEKLSGPFDVLRTPSGNLFFTEYGADRITRTKAGSFTYERFGGRGRGEGEFLGPQFMALDSSGYLYITDYGNRRVVKMDQEGNFILNFGQSQRGTFPGFLEPTGIAAMEGKIYVADARRQTLFVFDPSGNPLATLLEGNLSHPEGISSGYPGELIIVDDGRIYSFDIEMETLEPLADLRGKNSRILKAARDENDNILAVDFDAGHVSFLTAVFQFYAGLSVRIDRIRSEDFPRVVVDLTIEDSRGNPIVGLSEKNFIFTELSEGRHSPKKHTLLFRGNLSRVLHATLLVDRSPGMSSFRKEMEKTAAELYDSWEGSSTLRVVSAGDMPLLTAVDGTPREEFLQAARGEAEDFTQDGRFDLALRLAAGQVITLGGHRVILYLTEGVLGSQAFAGYDVLDLGAYLKNNGIRFYVLSTIQEREVSPELSYLCKETGGGSLFLQRPRGLRGFFDELVSVSNGSYTLEYTSLVDGDFGRRYILLQAEVLLYNRSGREKSGYFAPTRY